MLWQEAKRRKATKIWRHRQLATGRKLLKFYLDQIVVEWLAYFKQVTLANTCKSCQPSLRVASHCIASSVKPPL